MSNSEIPQAVACQAHLSIGFPRQEYRRGCHVLPQGIFPTQGLNPGLPHCRQKLYRLNHHIMRNAGLEEAQAGIKIARQNISNLRCADDNTLMTESKEELKSLLMKMKEENEKVDLKLNIQKTKIMASGPITSWQKGGETMETVRDYSFGLQNHCRW